VSSSLFHVIDHPFITDKLNDGHCSLTTSLVVVRDVWPISVGHR